MKFGASNTTRNSEKYPGFSTTSFTQEYDALLPDVGKGQGRILRGRGGNRSKSGGCCYGEGARAL